MGNEADGAGGPEGSDDPELPEGGDESASANQDELVPPGQQPTDPAEPAETAPGLTPPVSGDGPPPELSPPFGPPLSGIPTGPNVPRASRAPVVVLLGVVGALLVVVLVTFVVMAVQAERDKDQELTAHGAAIEDASAALTEAEDLINFRLNSSSNEFEATTEGGGEVACWYSYPQGEDDPNEFFHCGPLMFADSAPDTQWVQFPVRFRSDGETTQVDPGSSFSRRTWALDDEELVRPDGATPPEGDLQRPAAPVADAGAVGVTELEALMVDLDEADEDAHLVGIGHRTEVVAFASTDRVRMADEHLGQQAVAEAAEGEHWLLFQLATDRDFGAAEISYELRVDDESFQLDLGEFPDLRNVEEVLVVSVPADAGEVDLAVDDGVVEQSWSFTHEERSGDAPAVLYREDRVAQVDQTETLPYGKRDLHPIPGVPALDLGDEYYPALPGYDNTVPFGETEVSVEVREARLHYAIGTGFDGGVITASGPDRALLYLSDVSHTWGPEDAFSYPHSAGNVVLTLEDGTEIEASTAGGGLDDFTIYSDVDDIGVGPDAVFGSQLFWDVPADIRSATVTISPQDADDEFGMFHYEFQGGSISFDIEFD